MGDKVEHAGFSSLVRLILLLVGGAVAAVTTFNLYVDPFGKIHSREELYQSSERELKPLLGNLTFFFHQCPAERGDQNDTIYTKALREHPRRVFDPAIADVQISHLSCFVRVGHQADIRPPANVVARFETGLAAQIRA